MEMYESVEIPQKQTKRDKPNYLPICPYILWVTNDQEVGEVYIKIDGAICIHMGCQSPNESVLLSAITLLYKCHTAFDLAYHCYLKTFFSFFDILVGAKVKHTPTVAMVHRAVQALSKKYGVAEV